MVVYICIEQIISYYANFIPTIDSDRPPKLLKRVKRKMLNRWNGNGTDIRVPSDRSAFTKMHTYDRTHMSSDGASTPHSAEDRERMK
jgi:hypothetical protein